MVEGERSGVHTINNTFHHTHTRLFLFFLKLSYLCVCCYGGIVGISSGPEVVVFRGQR